MTAFEKCLFQSVGGSESALADALPFLIMRLDSDSPVWEWLKETGDETYRKETFEKVAKAKMNKWKKESL